MSSMCSIPTEPHRVLRHPGRLQLRLVQLRVGRRRVVDRERLRVADVREMAEQLQALDERLARIPAARDAERDEAAVAAVEDAIGDRLVRARVEAGIVHPGDGHEPREVAGDRQRVRRVPLDPRAAASPAPAGRGRR
jgi:hypothetical protein